jgi:hypothetical protein
MEREVKNLSEQGLWHIPGQPLSKEWGLKRPSMRHVELSHAWNNCPKNASNSPHWLHSDHFNAPNLILITMMYRLPFLRDPILNQI